MYIFSKLPTRAPLLNPSRAQHSGRHTRMTTAQITSQAAGAWRGREGNCTSQYPVDNHRTPSLPFLSLATNKRFQTQDNMICLSERWA